MEKNKTKIQGFDMSNYRTGLSSIRAVSAFYNLEVSITSACITDVGEAGGLRLPRMKSRESPPGESKVLRVTNWTTSTPRNSSRIGAMIVVCGRGADRVAARRSSAGSDREYPGPHQPAAALPGRARTSRTRVRSPALLLLRALLVILRRRQTHSPAPPARSHQLTDHAFRRRPRQHQQQRASARAGDARAGGASATRRFLSKRRFHRIKSPSKKSSAAEALVSSLVMVEGQSTASVDAVGDDEETTKASSDNGVGGDAKDEQHAAAGVVTTAFTISKSVEQTGAVGVRLLEGGDGVAVAVLATSNNVSPEKSSTATTTNNGSASHQSHMSDMSRVEILQKDAVIQKDGSAGTAPEKSVATIHRRDKKESLEAKRERKAAKTLAIITGAFVLLSTWSFWATKHLEILGLREGASYLEVLPRQQLLDVRAQRAQLLAQLVVVLAQQRVGVLPPEGARAHHVQELPVHSTKLQQASHTHQKKC
ncbi:Serotonin receptor 1A [Gryllus bimaculatus]|nr:Serotonin receptor 1A [Gryllus bimaculatus]